jgi:hypothetical protein
MQSGDERFVPVDDPFVVNESDMNEFDQFMT